MRAGYVVRLGMLAHAGRNSLIRRPPTGPNAAPPPRRSRRRRGVTETWGVVKRGGPRRAAEKRGEKAWCSQTTAPAGIRGGGCD